MQEPPELLASGRVGDACDAGLVAGLSSGLELRGALLLVVAAGTLSMPRVGAADGQISAAAAARLAEHVVVEDEE